MSPWHVPFYAYISFVLSFYKSFGGLEYVVRFIRGDRKPVKCMECGRDVFMVLHSLQDPSTSVLDASVLLKSDARVTNKKPVAEVRPDGDKSADKFLCVR